MDHIFLGVGYLSWFPRERISNRYGTIILRKKENEELYVKFNIGPLEGEFGRLFVKILETRKSSHIGDIFRGFVPGGAIVGETLLLGEGRLFSENTNGDYVIGVKPAEERNSDWLNPEMLYRAHEQLVELYFEKL